MVLEDENNDGTTFLGAVVQLGDVGAVETILDFIFQLEDHFIKTYFEQRGHIGRAMAHYLFNMPSLSRGLIDSSHSG